MESGIKRTMVNRNKNHTIPVNLTMCMNLTKCGEFQETGNAYYLRNL